MPADIMSKQFTIGAPSSGQTGSQPSGNSNLFNYNYYHQKNLMAAAGTEEDCTKDLTRYIS